MRQVYRFPDRLTDLRIFRLTDLDSLTDRPDRLADRLRLTDHTNLDLQRLADLETDLENEIQAYRLTDRLTNRLICRLTDLEMHLQTDI